MYVVSGYISRTYYNEFLYRRFDNEPEAKAYAATLASYRIQKISENVLDNAGDNANMVVGEERQQPSE